MSGPFAVYPADAGTVAEAGGRLSRSGSQAATVGQQAARHGVIAGGVESFGLFDEIAATVQPVSIAGARLEAAARVGDLALTVWARGIRGYDRTIDALNAEWATAKATDFGVTLELDRGAMKPADLDQAVAEHTDAVDHARDQLLADLIRRRNDAHDRLDRLADRVAALLHNADDPDIQQLAAAAAARERRHDREQRQIDELVDNAIYPDSLRQLNHRMNPNYWQALADGLPEELAAAIADASPESVLPDTSGWPDITGDDMLALIFGDPRQCIGDDADLENCGLELAAWLPLTKPLKLLKLGKHTDEAADLGDAGFEAARTAEEIGGGHAYAKHIEEFQDLGISTREQFSRHVEEVVTSPSEYRALERNRAAYWDADSGTVVIRDPNHPDGGTAFIPRRGYAYFRDNLK